MGAIIKALKGKLLQSKWSDLARIRNRLRIYTYKSHADPFKTKHSVLRAMSNMAFFGTQGQVTPK